MCVRALRITVLKSAGNFTRDEYHDLNAEKLQRVKCLCSRGADFFCVQAIFERRRGRLGSKISGYGQSAEVAVYFAKSGLRKQTPIGRVGMSAGSFPGIGLQDGEVRFTPQRWGNRPVQLVDS